MSFSEYSQKLGALERARELVVRIDPPPPLPTRAIAPTFVSLPASTLLVRVHGTKHLGPDDYNHNGPRGRFDHHHPVSSPTHDPLHGIYYAAQDLAGCIIEVFGDAGVVEPSGYGVAVVEVSRDLRLLDLTGKGAWLAGTVAAVTKDADRGASQAWARFFYSDSRYQPVDGIMYGNAHDDSPAYALFERAGSLFVKESHLLDDPRFNAELKDIALTLGIVPPP